MFILHPTPSPRTDDELREQYDLPQRSRRDALKVFSSLAAGAFLSGCGAATSGTAVASAASSTTATGTSTATTTAASSSSACLVATNVTRGPYFVDTINDPNISSSAMSPYSIDALIPQRSDIRADTEGAAGTQAGVTVKLTVLLYDTTCATLLSGARVDIWHCNAHGAYSDIENSTNDSGVDHRGQNFLRGYQFADATGQVSFTTIYPGAYSGRSPHIHLKIRILDAAGKITTEATTQLFFTDAQSAAVYEASGAYLTTGYNTKNGKDGIYNSESPTLLPTLTGTPTDGYTATIAIGVAIGTIYTG